MKSKKLVLVLLSSLVLVTAVGLGVIYWLQQQSLAGQRRIETLIAKEPLEHFIIASVMQNTLKVAYPINDNVTPKVTDPVNDKVVLDFPHWTASQFLTQSNFDAKGTLVGSSTPYFNFCLFAYSAVKDPQNARVLKIAQLFLDKGADVNSIDPKTGRTSLHEAVMFNQPDLVRFLIHNKADPLAKVNLTTSTFHGMTPLEFALRMQDIQKNREDFSEVIKLVEEYQRTVASPKNSMSH